MLNQSYGVVANFTKSIQRYPWYCLSVYYQRHQSAFPSHYSVSISHNKRVRQRWQATWKSKSLSFYTYQQYHILNLSKFITPWTKIIQRLTGETYCCFELCYQSMWNSVSLPHGLTDSTVSSASLQTPAPCSWPRRLGFLGALPLHVIPQEPPQNLQQLHKDCSSISKNKVKDFGIDNRCSTMTDSQLSSLPSLCKCWKLMGQIHWPV